MILSSVVAAILRPLARRALQAENKRLRDDNDALHTNLGQIVNRLVTANSTIADLQVAAERDKRSAARLLTSTKTELLKRINVMERQAEQLQEQLDSNAVTADNQRLLRQLTAVQADLDRADRRWFGHIASCDVALTLHDFDGDQERSNSE